MKKIQLAVMFLILATGPGYANNIQVANAALSGQNTASHTVLINFDVSWENSWRTSTNESNYDGAWIFVKFRKINTSNWQHCSINATGFTAPSGSSIKVSADGKGYWVYRSANGTGDVNFTGGKVVWNYGSNGVLDTDSCEIRVFAVEMVYVPQGSFYLGSGGTENYHFKDSTSNSPYLISSEGAFTYGTTNGNIYSSFGGASFSIPAGYPKGYNAYWCMKYECSQQQYVDFLNNLDLTRANANLPAGYFSGTHPNLVSATPERAMGSISTAFMLAWMDWAAMRPMAETEYEKACRGVNIVPIPNEYAWGNTTIIGATVINNAGTSSEYYDAAANTNTTSIGRMTRCGGFATASTAGNRQLSGATYYGIMDMSGNGWERVVSMINVPQCLAFRTSFHGDGNLNAAGTSDVTNWTDISNISSNYFSMRGSGYGNGVLTYYTTSDRTYAYTGFSDGAVNFTFRAARTGE